MELTKELNINKAIEKLIICHNAGFPVSINLNGEIINIKEV